MKLNLENDFITTLILENIHWIGGFSSAYYPLPWPSVWFPSTLSSLFSMNSHTLYYICPRIVERMKMNIKRPCLVHIELSKYFIILYKIFNWSKRYVRWWSQESTLCECTYLPTHPPTYQLGSGHAIVWSKITVSSFWIKSPT